MNAHKNARLTPHSRAVMVRRVLEEDWTASEPSASGWRATAPRARPVSRTARAGAKPEVTHRDLPASSEKLWGPPLLFKFCSIAWSESSSRDLELSLDNLSIPSGLHAPPRSAREAAEAILAQLDREAGRQNLNSPFAPFLAEGHRPDLMASAGRAFGEDNFAAPRAPAPSREDPGAFDIPYPAARNDDERIANVLWMLGNDASSANTPPKEIRNIFGNIFGLIGSAEAADNAGKLPGKKFHFLLEPLIEAVRELERTNSRRLVVNYYRNRIRELEPNNHLLETEFPPNHLVADEDLQRLKHEIAAAEERARLRRAFRARSLGGESIAAIRGRAIHRLYEAKKRAEGKRAEVSMPGIRIDGLDVDEQMNRAHVDELKPHYRVAIRRGERQAETGRPTTYSVDTYDPAEANDWLLGARFLSP